MTGATDTLLRQVLEVHDLDALIGPVPLAYTSRHGHALLIAGAHTGWAWCWCQPYVEMVSTRCSHGAHARVTHRRTADMPCPDRGGWDVDEEDGATYPAGQEPVS